MGEPFRINIEKFDFSLFSEPGKYSFELWFEPDQPNVGLIPVNLIKGERPGPTLIIFAAVHGDEYEGVQTIIQLYRMLKPEDIYGTLIMIPVANVSSYYHGTRTTGVDGENLARAFLGSSKGSFTENLADILDHTFIAKADFFLDLHSGGSDYAMPPMVGYDYNSENKVGTKSKSAAEAFGMPVLWGHKTIGPGRTISSAIRHNVPWIYTEGFGGKRIRPQEQRFYEQGTLRLMKHLDMMKHPERWITEPQMPITHRLVGDGNLDKVTKAEQDGFFIPCVQMLDKVEAGDCIGVIYDWFGTELQYISAKQTGIVMMLRGTPYTLKNDGIYTLADLE